MPNLFQRRKVILASAFILVIVVAAYFINHSLTSDYLAASRLKLIDSFDQPFQRNLIGGENMVRAFGNAQLEMDWTEALSQKRGRAAQLNYRFNNNDRAHWVLGLNALDISQARTLRFDLRLPENPPEIQLELVGYDGGAAFSDILELRPTTKWQSVEIPLQVFKGVNFNRLSSLTFRFRAVADDMVDSILFDDIGFIGPPEVFTESLKDNLYGFPDEVLADTRPLQELPPQYVLKQIAADTWKYFENIVDREHHLPLNYIQTAPRVIVGDYTSPTDIAMYLMGLVSAVDLGLIEESTALERTRNTLIQIHELPKIRGLLHNYYNTTNLQVTNAYISSVDNAWLASSLVVLRQAYPQLRPGIDALIDQMDFGFLYDAEVGQLHIGYDPDADIKSPHHYGMLISEARVASWVGIGLGDIPESHWFSIYRTLPSEWDWQRQKPQGEVKTYRGYPVFQGYYEYPSSIKGQIPYVPSWGGSLFEFLMPGLIVDEQSVAPRSLGLNNLNAVDIQIEYLTKEKRLPVWGMSPSATPEDHPSGGYAEFGIPELGAKGYSDEGIVTPHASILAIGLAPAAVLENLRQLLRRYRIYGPYGMYDAVDTRNGRVAYRYLALDQGMILVALNNYLNNGAIQQRFQKDEVFQKIEPLLRMENFFPSDKSQ